MYSFPGSERKNAIPCQAKPIMYDITSFFPSTPTNVKSTSFIKHQNQDGVERESGFLSKRGCFSTDMLTTWWQLG